MSKSLLTHQVVPQHSQLPMETKVLEQVEDHILLLTYQDQLQMNLYSDVQLLLLTLQQMLMMS